MYYRNDLFVVLEILTLQNLYSFYIHRSEDIDWRNVKDREHVVNLEQYESSFRKIGRLFFSYILAKVSFNTRTPPSR